MLYTQALGTFPERVKLMESKEEHPCYMFFVLYIGVW